MGTAQYLARALKEEDMSSCSWELKSRSRNLRHNDLRPRGSQQTALGMHVVAAMGQSEYGFKSVR